MDNAGKGLILRLVVFDYLGGSNYLNSFGLIRRWMFKTICLRIRTIKISRNADWDGVAAINWCGTRETLLVNHLLQVDFIYVLKIFCANAQPPGNLGLYKSLPAGLGSFVKPGGLPGGGCSRLELIDALEPLYPLYVSVNSN